jgi:hypothetical protein
LQSVDVVSLRSTESVVPLAQIARSVDIKCDAWIESNRYRACRDDTLAMMCSTAIGSKPKAQCGPRRQVERIGTSAMLIGPYDDFSHLFAAIRDAQQIAGCNERQIGRNNQNRIGSRHAQYFHTLANRVIQAASRGLTDRQHGTVGSEAKDVGAFADHRSPRPARESLGSSEDARQQKLIESTSRVVCEDRP